MSDADRDVITAYIQRGFFAEAAYFAALRAQAHPTADAHMLAGVACGGCTRPLATAQRLLEGVRVDEEELGAGGVHVSPLSQLPYEAFFHLVQAMRLDPGTGAPDGLGRVFDSVADDLAFVSRRELTRAPGERRRYSLRTAALGAAILLRALTGSERPLPGVTGSALATASEIVERERAGSGGDAAFLIGFGRRDEP